MYNVQLMVGCQSAGVAMLDGGVVDDCARLNIG